MSYVSHSSGVPRAGNWPAAWTTRRQAADAAAEGAVSGGVRTVLRLEGLVVLLASVAGYGQFGAGWGAFATLFLVPDLSVLGYLAGPRTGAAIYNLAHAYALPVALLALGAVAGLPVALAVGLIWCAHIGFDRMLGLGLKYGSGFAATHLGRIGPADPW
ncbi:protein of unknown function [Variovorax sp. HW608]|uniref:DUF4260 domain-containing protein n=1 Tax=Variovorax sp. HW608 TaxID=1034889 RepID=UPI00082017B8|nr:DUF4260 domain-containing protein [Variovorax sp. HW608]SCK35904.1 protein of unknown function [Variovorax sp. HW608]